MYKKIRVFILGVLFFSGCATMNQKQAMEAQQLQNRIDILERELDKKEQQITTLENQLESRPSRAAYIPKEAIIDSASDESLLLSKSEIQTALKNAGFYEGPIDGKIGPKTKDAIIAFQKENGLKTDGVVGRKTSSELRRYLSE